MLLILVLASKNMARVRNPETCPNTLSMLRFLPVIAKSSNATLRLVLWMLEPLPLQEPAETSVRNSTKHCGSGPSQPKPAHEIDLIQSGSIWSIMTTSFYMSKLLALPRMHIKNDTSLTRRCLLKSLAGTIAGQSKVIAYLEWPLWPLHMVWLCKAHLSCLQTSGRRKGARRSRARACCNCNFCNFCNFTRCRCSRCSRCSRCRFDRFDRFDWRACRRGRAGDVWASLRTAKA